MIQSHLIEVIEAGRQYRVYDTVFNHRHYLTACGIGTVNGHEAMLTEAGQATLVAAADYAKNAYGPAFTIRLQAISPRGLISKKVRRALEAAHPKCLVFFVCDDTDVYDAVFAALGVNAQNNRTVQ